MPAGVKLHFCSVLWSSNGGPLDNKGRPIDPKRSLSIITDDDIAYHDLLEELAREKGQEYNHPYARGRCEADYDCAQCTRLEEAINKEGYTNDQINWVCPPCAKKILREIKQITKNYTGSRYPITAPGHYGEGVCMYHLCERPPRTEEAEGAPGISTRMLIETPPGYSRFLQLFLGPLNTLL